MLGGMSERTRIRIPGSRAGALGALLAAAGAAAAPLPRQTPSVARTADSAVVISAFLADGQMPGDADEAIQLWNLGDEATDLAGWSVGDAAGRAVFPPERGSRRGPSGGWAASPAPSRRASARLRTGPGRTARSLRPDWGCSAPPAADRGWPTSAIRSTCAGPAADKRTPSPMTRPARLHQAGRARR